MIKIIDYFEKKVLSTYLFNLLFSGIIIIGSIVLFNTHIFAKIALVIGSIYFLIFLVLYVKKRKLIHTCFEDEKLDEISEYKTIDSGVFTQKVVYSYCLDNMVKMEYKDIVSVCHSSNIWEKTRPGYQGNHKVILKDQKNVIQVMVSNGEIADKIMNFIATLNPNCALENAPSERVEVQLSDLDNWQVRERF